MPSAKDADNICLVRTACVHAEAVAHGTATKEENSSCRHQADRPCCALTAPLALDSSSSPDLCLIFELSVRLRNHDGPFDVRRVVVRTVLLLPARPIA